MTFFVQEKNYFDNEINQKLIITNKILIEGFTYQVGIFINIFDDFNKISLTKN